MLLLSKAQNVGWWDGNTVVMLCRIIHLLAIGDIALFHFVLPSGAGIGGGQFDILWQMLSVIASFSVYFFLF